MTRRYDYSVTRYSGENFDSCSVYALLPSVEIRVLLRRRFNLFIAER